MLRTECMHGVPLSGDCGWCKPELVKPKKLSPTERFRKHLTVWAGKHPNCEEMTLAELKKGIPRMPWCRKHEAHQINDKLLETARNKGKFWTPEEFTSLVTYWKELEVANPEEWGEVAEAFGRTLYGLEVQLRFIALEEVFEKALKRRISIMEHGAKS